MAELLDDVAASWIRDLRAADRSPRTIKQYMLAVNQFRDWLVEHDREPTVDGLTKHAIATWLGDLADAGREPATLQIRYKGLHRFVRWLVAEDELEKDPMAGIEPATVKPKPVPLVTDGDVTKLLRTCEGKSYDDRRDQAILRVLFDCGIRISECAGLELADVDLKHHDVVRVHGKGDVERAVPFGAKTGRALDRFLRARRDHRLADTTDALWLGIRGGLTADGVEYALKKRVRQAGIEHIHAHQFRHGFAHSWLVQGGQERDLKRLMGWKSDSMLERYGSSAADERARAAFKRMRLGDRL
ncbi:tyrosine-type recombinase/integrase [Kribbella shirazensis]|uniref:Site-specific recombinase XerD n=1 Tax=Kribbella shirazensis TaxID=1105143 RepID=A0A7X5VAY7_9ACTN|nr:tyrosine-type recombinase/integrase [Kribbella shirazensis]NIK57896.1 site-specific recombinase XerD [Kribbella shirazensis]